MPSYSLSISDSEVFWQLSLHSLFPVETFVSYMPLVHVSTQILPY